MTTTPSARDEREAFENSRVTRVLHRNSEPGLSQYYGDMFTQWAWTGWQARATLAESELAEVREQNHQFHLQTEQMISGLAEKNKTINELRAELDRVKAENVYVPIPHGWTVRRLHPEDGVAFVIGTPRVDGVSSHTAVWSDAESPAEALLALMLDTHPADIGTEKVLIGYLKPGALEIMQLMPDEWLGGAKLKRDPDSRYTVPVYAAIGAGEGEAG